MSECGTVPYRTLTVLAPGQGCLLAGAWGAWSTCCSVGGGFWVPTSKFKLGKSNPSRSGESCRMRGESWAVNCTAGQSKRGVCRALLPAPCFLSSFAAPLRLFSFSIFRSSFLFRAKMSLLSSSATICVQYLTYFPSNKPLGLFTVPSLSFRKPAGWVDAGKANGTRPGHGG